MKFFLIILGFLALAFPARTNTTFPVPVSPVMVIGEELVYEVSWSFLKLGTIRIKTLPPQTPGSVFSAVAYSDSYDLPFVDFHAFSTSEMDSALYSTGASLFDKKENQWLRQIYYFTPSTLIYVTENAYVKDMQSSPIDTPTYDTLKLNYNRFQDGTSILYFARAHAHDSRAVALPTLVRGKAGITNLYFPSERTTETIDAIEEPIKVVQVEGKAEFEGIFGLTGDFTGWFSDDAAAIPVKAKLKVILGSITLELQEWNRPGWSPPIAD